MPMGTKFFPPELEEPRLGDMEVIDSRVFVHTKAFRIQADAQVPLRLRTPSTL